MAALASDTLTTLPSRGCHTLPGHGGRVDVLPTALHLLPRVEVYQEELLGQMLPVFFGSGHKLRIFFILLNS